MNHHTSITSTKNNIETGIRTRAFLNKADVGPGEGGKKQQKTLDFLLFSLRTSPLNKIVCCGREVMETEKKTTKTKKRPRDEADGGVTAEAVEKDKTDDMGHSPSGEDERSSGWERIFPSAEAVQQSFQTTFASLEEPDSIGGINRLLDVMVTGGADGLGGVREGKDSSWFVCYWIQAALQQTGTSDLWRQRWLLIQKVLHDRTSVTSVAPLGKTVALLEFLRRCDRTPLSLVRPQNLVAAVGAPVLPIFADRPATPFDPLAWQLAAEPSPFHRAPRAPLVVTSDNALLAPLGQLCHVFVPLSHLLGFVNAAPSTLVLSCSTIASRISRGWVESVMDSWRYIPVDERSRVLRISERDVQRRVLRPQWDARGRVLPQRDFSAMTPDDVEFYARLLDHASPPSLPWRLMAHWSCVAPRLFHALSNTVRITLGPDDTLEQCKSDSYVRSVRDMVITRHALVQQWRDGVCTVLADQLLVPLCELVVSFLIRSLTRHDIVFEMSGTNANIPSTASERHTEMRAYILDNVFSPSSSSSLSCL